MLITHIGEDAELASRVGLMDDGRIIAEGDPEKLKKNSGLKNVVEVEILIKSDRVSNALMKFSESEKVLETERGYRVYCKDPETVTPDIVRSLDRIGCKATRIETVRPSLEDVFFKLTEKTVRKVS